ncbi:MAG: amidohydrolase [Syntrophobacterales bacterium]|nr:amidohydrolase [Syntrophobacterales bacterium]
MSQKFPKDFGVHDILDLILCDVDYLITCSNDLAIIQNGAVAILKGRIYDLGDSEEIKARYRARETLSLKGYILMPGLINAHVHAPMSLFRGLADDLPLEVWLSEVIFPTESKWVKKETVYLGSLLSFCEMILSGVTCFCDGYFFEEEVVRAAVEVGIRGIAGQGILDFPTPDAPSSDRMFERAERFLSSTHSEMVRPSLFCHALYTCSAATVKRTKELCQAYGALFQIHLAETEWERSKVLELTGKSPVEFLEDLALLDENTLCVHGVWLSDEDLNILNDRGTGLVHCLESNLKLASGVANLPLWLERGLKVGIGTDGPASNNNLDVLGEMGMVAKLHKGFRRDPTLCSAWEVLKLGTILGARAIGLGEEIGSLEVGKRADCIALSISEPHAIPLYNPISHIVYSAKASDVKYVWIDGKPIVRDGRLVSLNLEEMLKEARRISQEIGKRRESV